MAGGKTEPEEGERPSAGDSRARGHFRRSRRTDRRPAGLLGVWSVRSRGCPDPDGPADEFTRARPSTLSFRTASRASAPSPRSRWHAGSRATASRSPTRPPAKPGASSASWRPIARASLQELTRRCLLWRDTLGDVMRDGARRSGAFAGGPPAGPFDAATEPRCDPGRICECFETERLRTDEELDRRQDELSFMATHDPLTGLPNRTLMLDRVEQMLVACPPAIGPCRSAVHRSRQLQEHQRHARSQGRRRAHTRSPRGWKASCARPTRWDGSAETNS